MLGSILRALRGRGGNAAMMFCLAAPALATLTGMSIDFTIMEKAKRLLQDSLDAAVLAAARSDADTPAERSAVATEYARTNFAGRYSGANFVVTITEGQDGELLGAASLDVPTFFGGLIGKGVSRIDASSAVKIGGSNLEVMLVLDKTGSMGGPKLDALRAAAKDLVEQTMDGEAVKVGIVPFARYVNIGLGLRHEPGFSVPDDHESCTDETVWHGANERNCHVVESTCYNDGAPYACSWTSCDYDYTSTTENVCHMHTWNGCVGSRDEPLNKEDSGLGAPVPGLMDIGCGSDTLVRLTTDKTRVSNALDALSADGETYIPSGLMMGWHALTDRPILPDGVDPNSSRGRTTLRAIVLMTDGANTASKTDGAADHESGDVTKANNLTRDLCRNIKDDNVRVFTVAFDVDDNDIKAILRNCATASEDAYAADDSAQLSAAFRSIGLSLARLRLTR